MILIDSHHCESAGRGACGRQDRTLAVLTQIPPDRLADILDIAEDGIITVDARQNIVLFNGGAAKLFGYDPAEVAGQPLELLLPESYRHTHQKQVAEFGGAPEPSRTMGARREVLGRRKDGSEFPAEVSISKFGSEGALLYTAIVRDVTERKRYEASAKELDRLRESAKLATAEASARANESQFRRIVETANEGIWELDADARVTFVNDRMAELLGRSRGEILGRPKWDFLFAEDQAHVRSLFERRRAGISEQVDVRFRRPGGQAVWTSMSAKPIVGPVGEFRGALDMFTDITARRLAEENLRETTRQLWQVARLAGVGELAASIAHELNNPLGTVALRVESLLAKLPADSPHRRPLEVVEQEVERMAGLVGNLLQFSRAGRDQVSTVDVTDEVNKTLELVGHHLRKRQVRVEPDFAPTIPPILADRQQLRQVFLNLLTNAADAMPGGGRLVPRIRAGRLSGALPAVVIEVSDTGIGIPPELLDRVFEPFFTTKDEGKGTGLGLAICRRIVQQHQGTVEVESQLGLGTTVRITLPVRPHTNVASLHAN